MIKETFFQIRVIHLSDCRCAIPLFFQMWLLVRQVSQNLLEAVDFIGDGGENTRLEQELLEFNEHTTFFQTLSLHTTIVDLLKLLEIGFLEDLLDLFVNYLIEILRGRIL